MCGASLTWSMLAISDVNFYCDAKHSTFTTGGHAKSNTDSLYVLREQPDAPFEAADTLTCHVV